MKHSCGSAVREAPKQPADYELFGQLSIENDNALGYAKDNLEIEIQQRIIAIKHETQASHPQKYFCLFSCTSIHNIILFCL